MSNAADDVLHIHDDDDEMDLESMINPVAIPKKSNVTPNKLRQKEREKDEHRAKDTPTLSPTSKKSSASTPSSSATNPNPSTRRSNSPNQVTELGRVVGERLNVSKSSPLANSNNGSSSSKIDQQQETRGDKGDGDGNATDEMETRGTSEEYDEPMDVLVDDERRQSEVSDQGGDARMTSHDDDLDASQEQLIYDDQIDAPLTRDHDEEGALGSDDDVVEEEAEEDDGEYQDANAELHETEDSSADSASSATSASGKKITTTSSTDQKDGKKSDERSERSQSKKRKVSPLERDEERREKHADPAKSSSTRKKPKTLSHSKEGRMVRDDRRMDMFFMGARFFLIKSGNSENVSLSKQMEKWATTPRNEEILNKAFRQTRNVILVFSVEKSQGFQGFCRMASESRRDDSPVRWVLPPGMNVRNLGGIFRVHWLNKKELPFAGTMHLTNPWNDRKPVKIGRDGTEIAPQVGKELCDLFSSDDGVNLDAIGKKVLKMQDKVGRATMMNDDGRPPMGAGGERRQTNRYSEMRPIQRPRLSAGGGDSQRTAPLGHQQPNSFHRGGGGGPTYNYRGGPPSRQGGGGGFDGGRRSFGASGGGSGGRYAGVSDDTLINGSYSDYIREYMGPPYGYSGGHHGGGGGGYYGYYPPSHSFNDSYGGGGYGAPYGGNSRYPHHQQQHYGPPSNNGPYHRGDGGDRRGNGSPYHQNHHHQPYYSDAPGGGRGDKYARGGRDISAERYRHRSQSPPPPRAAPSQRGGPVYVGNRYEPRSGPSDGGYRSGGCIFGSSSGSFTSRGARTSGGHRPPARSPDSGNDRRYAAAPQHHREKSPPPTSASSSGRRIQSSVTKQTNRRD